MSKLEYYSRPLVAFDAANKQHRQYYYNFLKNNTWGHCPVRFICPAETGSDLIKMMQRLLVDYYIKKEFNTCDTSLPAGTQKASSASKTLRRTSRTTGTSKKS